MTKVINREKLHLYEYLSYLRKSYRIYIYLEEGNYYNDWDHGMRRKIRITREV